MGCSPRIFSVSLALVFVLLLNLTEARDHLIGGKADGWRVPSSESDSLNKWAQKSRFQIGDNLVWKYDSKKDSVLEVRRDAYLKCNTNSSSSIAVHKEDETKVELTKSGPYYFISGIQANCEKGEKLVVVVMAARSRRAVSPAVAPSPESENEAPAVAPTSNASGLKAGVMLAVGVLAGFVII